MIDEPALGRELRGHTRHATMAIYTNAIGPEEQKIAVRMWERASLLEAAEYSPEIAAVPGDKLPRIFDLRVYQSPTYRQHLGVQGRFAGPEIKSFHGVGIHPVLYASTLIGQNIPNLTCLIPSTI